MIARFAPTPSPPVESPDERAERLLARVLTEDQQAELKSQGYLDVPGKNDVYRISYPGSRQVEVFCQGRCVGNLCVRPVELLLKADWVVALVLMIQGDEDNFRKTATFIPPSDRPR